MFYFRSIDKDMQIDRVLGDSYSLVLKSQNPEYFSNCFKEHFGKEPEQDSKCVGFVLGDTVVALYLGSFYYIMNDNGKTYDNISSHL